MGRAGQGRSVVVFLGRAGQICSCVFGQGRVNPWLCFWAGQGKSVVVFLGRQVAIRISCKLATTN